MRKGSRYLLNSKLFATFVWSILLPAMNHDVFISYSSKNPTAAQAICHELEENKIKCWMAPRDIPVGSKYASVITQAIKECKVVVLVFSSQSAISPWVESEINIAFSNRKPIVPYKIDTANLESYDEFYLMLNNRHWIEAYPDFKTRFAELVNVISNLMGVVSSTVGTSSVVSHIQTSVARSYKIGDYYDDGVKKGVVFDVWDSGRHGKIVSLDEAFLPWCTREHYDKEKIALDTSSKYDGMENTQKVMARLDADQYPAFKWCMDHGSGWYLPAINELEHLLLNVNVQNTVNRTLEQYGASMLFKIGADARYWSSTEPFLLKAYAARQVTMIDASTQSFNKTWGEQVRAVAIF